MRTKSLRIPEDMIHNLAVVEKEEKIEEATAIRKLIRMGYETYIVNHYKEGKITLREASKFLNMSQFETINLFMDAGIKGNLTISDVMPALERFVLH